MHLKLLGQIRICEPVPVGHGKVLGAAINFIIVAFVIFLFAKHILKEEKVEKK